MALGGVMGSKLLQHMNMFNAMDDDFKMLPAIPTKYTVYNIYGGSLARNLHGMPVLNGGFYPRLCNVIGQSATGKTSFLIGAACSAVDNIRLKYGNGYSEMFFFDVEGNTPTERFLSLSHWTPADFMTKCNYSNDDLSLTRLADLIIRISETKTRCRKDYSIPSGLRDIDGREIMYLAPTFICVDSVAAVNPNGVETLVENGRDGEMKEITELAKNTEGMTDAKAWTIFVRKVKPYLDKGNIGLYCINHKTKENKLSMFDKEVRYLPFLAMGEKLKGGNEFIFQSYNIFDLQSGEKINDKNPIYGDELNGFSTRCSFVKNKANIEGAQFPMVFDQFKGYMPELSDLEYLWQHKYGFDGVSKIALDILPEVQFTRKTFLKAAEEYPQLLRALQFTTRFHASNKMLYRSDPVSLKDLGENVRLEERLSIIYNYTTPYEKEIASDQFKNFSELANSNSHYFNFGNFTKTFDNAAVSNNDIDRSSMYAMSTNQGVTPYDLELGNCKILDGKYAILKSDLPIISGDEDKK